MYKKFYKATFYCMLMFQPLWQIQACLSDLESYPKETCLTILQNVEFADLWNNFLSVQTTLYFDQESELINNQNFWKDAQHVLEIGSGNGAYLHCLSEKFQQKNYTGVEKESNLVDQANQQFANLRLEFKQGNAEFENLAHVNAFDVVLFRLTLQHLKDPKLALEHAYQYLKPGGHVIIIDEIQKVPELLSLVHILIEEKQGWIFILTGSSARKLNRAGVDLLGGRALKKNLFPFMAAELGELFNFEDALKFGMLPLRFEDPNPLETLKTYVALYMEEEVKAEGIVRNIEPFVRFLQAISFSHGADLNVTNIARDCMVKRTTVTSWISILEDLMIAFQLPVFTKRAKRDLSSHPKFYFFDAGVFRAIRPLSIEDPLTELEGPALEGLVAQHLRAWCDYTEGENSLAFWRTRSGVEVDFVVHSPLGLWAIEVKNTRNISAHDLRHLKIFLEDYPEAKAIFLYRGTDRLLRGNVLCMPVGEFLAQLKPNIKIVSF